MMACHETCRCSSPSRTSRGTRASHSSDIFGALWLADYVGAFLTAGGNAVYYFHYLPMGVHRGCNDSMGTFGMFTVDKDYQIQHPRRSSSPAS